MFTQFHVVMFIAATLLFCLCNTGTMAQSYSDSRWDSRFGTHGIDAPIQGQSVSVPIAPVQCMVDDGGDVILGGQFGSVARNVVRWNRSQRRWEDLGEGLDSTVRALAVQGNTIYAAGYFQYSGNTPLRSIATFDKSSGNWSAMADGIYGSVNALCVYKGQLYAAGVFAKAGKAPCRNIACWTGSEWKSLGEGLANGVNGEVYGLCVYKDKLCCIGMFDDIAGDTSLTRCALWDGSKWSGLPQSFSLKVGRVSQQRFLACAAHDSLLALVGQFDSVYTGSSFMPTKNIVIYDGMSWSSPIVSMDTGKGGLSRVAISDQDLYCGNGNLTNINSSFVNAIARWNRATRRWFSLGSGLSSDSTSFSLNAICAYNDAVLVGGRFAVAGTTLAQNIAEFRLASNEWLGLGTGPCAGFDDNCVIAALPSGLTAAGTFLHSGSNALGGIARWDGLHWNPIGPGIIGGFTKRAKQNTTPPWPSPMVYSLAEYKGSYYIGGDFLGTGTVKSNCLVAYDGTTARSVDGGMFQSTGWDRFGVNALLVQGNSLYAGGAFKRAGTLQDTVFSIARWDGTQWNTLGAGFPSDGYYAPIECLADDGNGGLFAGGFFQACDTARASSLALWSNSTWTPYAFVPEDGWSHIMAITRTSSSLFVAGNFDIHGGHVCNGIAEWDGHQWLDLDGGMVNGVWIRAMAVKGDELYVGGRFRAIGNIAARNCAVWNMKTRQWRALGSGLDSEVVSIAVVGDTVFFSGLFRQAGKKSSSHIAAWLPSGPVDVPETQEQASSELLLYPNPTSSQLHCSWNSTMLTDATVLELRNTLGDVVLQRNLKESLDQSNSASSVLVDCSSLASGTYYALVHSAQHSVCARIVVLH